MIRTLIFVIAALSINAGATLAAPIDIFNGEAFCKKFREDQKKPAYASQLAPSFYKSEMQWYSNSPLNFLCHTTGNMSDLSISRYGRGLVLTEGQLGQFRGTKIYRLPCGVLLRMESATCWDEFYKYRCALRLENGTELWKDAYLKVSSLKKEEKPRILEFRKIGVKSSSANVLQCTYTPAAIDGVHNTYASFHRKNGSDHWIELDEVPGLVEWYVTPKKLNDVTYSVSLYLNNTPETIEYQCVISGECKTVYQATKVLGVEKAEPVTKPESAMKKLNEVFITLAVIGCLIVLIIVIFRKRRLFSKLLDMLRRSSELDAIVSAQRSELNAIAAAQISELDTIAAVQRSELDAIAAAQGSELDTVASAQRSELDAIAAAKGSELDTIAAAKGSELDTIAVAQGSELDAMAAAQGSELDAIAAVQGSQLDAVASAQRSQLTSSEFYDRSSECVSDDAQNCGATDAVASTYTYDAFLCYSSKDRDWVKNTLLAGLQRRGYQCCIDYKDFLAGAFIFENIHDAIYNSRNTIAVLSPEFIESSYCARELWMALSRVENHQVIPVIIRGCDVPPDLKHLITYLEWTDPDDHCWQILERSMSTRPARNCHELRLAGLNRIGNKHFAEQTGPSVLQLLNTNIFNAQNRDNITTSL